MAETIVKRGIYLYIDGKQVAYSANQIKKELSNIVAEQKKATIGSKEYVAAGEKIRSLKAILQQHSQQLKVVASDADKAGSSFSSMSGVISKMTAVAAGAIGTIVALGYSIDQFVKSYTKMKEAEAQVTKYTNMSKEEVNDLNESLKKFDTRTSREKLNELAGDAGRLGTRSKDQILEFVDAADKINVALGEDLGKDAVKDIGKLAKMFGESDRLGLRAAMLATGSAINEVAQNSSSAEGYLVDFLGRVSGAANQAHMAQTDLIGFAAVLDQNKQQVEMSATAFQGLIMKLYQDPARFAKIAGLEVKSFSKLLRDDANEALLLLIGTLGKKGGLAELAPMFEEMKLDGARASGVLSALASNIDQVRIEQERANAAYKDGTSITKEFNVQNSTPQAELDKAQKRLEDYRIELGEKLYPIQKAGIATMGDAMNVLSQLTTYVIEHRTVIISAAAAVAGYSLVVGKAALSTKILSAATAAGSIIVRTYKGVILLSRAAFAVLTGDIQAATVAMRTFSLVTKLSPVGLLVGTITALTVMVFALTTKMDKLTQSQERALAIKKMWQDIDGKVNQQLGDQKSKIDLLNSIIHNNTVANGDRIAAIKELQKIVPGYVAEISNEGKVLRENTKAVNLYLKALEKKYKLEAAKDQLKDIATRELQSEQQLAAAEKSFKSAKDKYNKEKSKPIKSNTPGVVNLGESNAAKSSAMVEMFEQEKLIKQIKETKAGIAAEKKDLTNFITSSKLTDSLFKKPEKQKEAPYTKPQTDAEKTKAQREALLRIEKEYDEKRNALRQKYLSGDIKTEEEYTLELKSIEMDQLKATMNASNIAAEKQEEAKTKYLDIKVELKKKLSDINEEVEEDAIKSYDKQIEKLRDKQDEQAQAIRIAYNNGIIPTEEDMQKQLLALKEYYAAKELDITKKKHKEEAKLTDKQKRTLAKKYEVQLREQMGASAEMLGNIGLNFKDYFKKLEEYREGYQKIIENSDLFSEDEVDQAKDNLAKVEDQMKDMASKLSDMVQDIGTELGESFSDLFSGESGAFKEFGKSIIKLALSTLEDLVLIQQQQLLVIALASLNPLAIIKATLKIAAIKAAFAMVKGLATSYDTGGYTGEGAWDEPAGVVHKKEFVSNRFAVANPNLRPIMDLIDTAQKNGTVQNLTASDVAAVSGSSSSSTSSAKSASSIAAANSDLQSVALLSLLNRVNGTLTQVNKRFNKPIVAETYATGKGGVNEAQKLVNKMEANASRKR